MLAYTASDVAYIALAVFLVAVGLALAWAFVALAGTFTRLSSFVKGTEEELLPVIAKVGGTVDRVDAEIDKLDQATDSAVDAVVAADQAVRAVSFAIKKPVEKIAGFATGATFGWASLRAGRGWRGAYEAAREAAARREDDLEAELRRKPE